MASQHSEPTDPWAGLAGEPLADALAVAAHLPSQGRVGIAFSGGVDSAVLLAVAVRARGRADAVGLLAVSDSLARAELAGARATAAEIGADLIEFATREGELPAYRANGVDRCFHCKDEMFTVIDTDLVERHGLAAVAYGENADDAARIDRPGAGAATAHAVLRPLATAGLSKPRVRNLARALGLSVADKPAAPCLASRIPHGQEVTPAKLKQVEAGEEALREAGFTDARVRHHGDIARIEVPADEIALFADPDRRTGVLARLREAGFGHVTVDLAGLQSGAFTLQVLRRG
ncbi:MAG: ATP-dependent sacrificial sulfur transferase LarE [Propionibacteriaceae bacterium]|nr:ATP-dependent sacrificial sulfur transferase LarE [Propionibacteriaceae bacterium]